MMNSGRQPVGISSDKGRSMDATGRIPKKTRAVATQEHQQPQLSSVAPTASATSRSPDEDPVAEARKALAMYEEISGESPAIAAASGRNKRKQSSGGGGGGGKKSDIHASAPPSGVTGTSSSSEIGMKSPTTTSRQSNNGQRKERAKGTEEMEKRRKRRRDAEALRKTFKPRISDSTYIL